MNWKTAKLVQLRHPASRMLLLFQVDVQPYGLFIIHSNEFVTWYLPDNAHRVSQPSTPQGWYGMWSVWSRDNWLWRSLKLEGKWLLTPKLIKLLITHPFFLNSVRRKITKRETLQSDKKRCLFPGFRSLLFLLHTVSTGTLMPALSRRKKT